MIDEHGYRPNVGIILCNRDCQVFWARRCGRDGWQFPQGGIKSRETAEQALYRELYEEVGLETHHVEVLGRTRDWLHYDIPSEFRRRNPNSPFRGQKQLWFLLRLVGSDRDVRLDCCDKPEFDSWRWIEYWGPLQQIIAFKRDVYRMALTELEPLLGRS
ncbi:RNA pyrophosphohydrolase [Sulfurifustis variabilis]|uniref:RNA pyrophosphohydrolase n=1 Tax=Sulfurifustis variabilis TaxID=1675686 RepID=A0A1B4V5A9_9GAMM|nr:RNA pyrophosphohydrolase [Sulfurifustis variabilis]BAU47732.1 RNA pyrophosphohydrolase [Sulfurifustis variabilis]